jgi:glycosyltransferase involved in cell wall biosynthesis
VRPLRIGVDARELLGDATGVGRYLGELIRRWTARPDAANRRFLLYAPSQIPLPLHPGSADVIVVPARRHGTWWEQTALRRIVGRDAPDVFFAPAYTAPLGVRMPVVVTIHDVSFAAHPEWFRPRERLRRRWLTRATAERAAVVLTDSEFSRREIARCLRVPPARIRVIPPGVVRRRERGVEPRDPTVLYVGSIFNRRRLPDLLDAFARATRDLPEARLIIVGDNRTWPRQDLAAIASSLGIASRVRLLNYVEDSALIELYRRAAVFGFLSEYEGFGLTPLEALDAGVPPVVLDTAVAREVYGPAALYVPGGDPAAAGGVLRTLLTDPAARAVPLAHAEEVLGRYSWDRAADDTLEEIERAARRR